MLIKFEGMRVSSLAVDALKDDAGKLVFEGYHRVILRQPNEPMIDKLPQAYKSRLNYSGFAIRMKSEQVEELGLAVGQVVNFEATKFLGTTLGSRGSAPLVEWAGVTITSVEVAAEEAVAELEW